MSARNNAFKDSFESKDPPLINNRQAGRRNNRGRNNGRQGGGNRGGGSGDSGNRIDSRARGNAPQLLEKYRNMARDAQLADDRVNIEYYLQFADHYFRVIADNRARQEEQQASRQRRYEENQGEDNSASDSDSRYSAETSADGGEANDSQSERGNRRPGPRARQAYEGDDMEGGDDQRPARSDRKPRARSRQASDDIDSSAEADENNQAGAPKAEEEVKAPRRAPRARKPRKVAEAGSDEASGIDLAALPPAITRTDDSAESAEEAPAPKRRTRRPRVAKADTAEAAE